MVGVGGRFVLYFGGCVVSEQSLAVSVSVMMCKRAHQWFSGCHVDFFLNVRLSCG